MTEVKNKKADKTGKRGEGLGGAQGVAVSMAGFYGKFPFRSLTIKAIDPCRFGVAPRPRCRVVFIVDAKPSIASRPFQKTEFQVTMEELKQEGSGWKQKNDISPAGEEAVMDVDVKASQESEAVEACPLDAPTYGRVPGLLSLAAATAGVFTQPAFFGLGAALLAVLSLLLSPPRCRLLGLAALVAACVVGLRVLF